MAGRVPAKIQYRKLSASVQPRWQAHYAAWHNCERCPLHLTRSSVCLYRGMLPAPVLFIGEGPGESEDAHGTPFVGPAGDKLDELLLKTTIRPDTYCISNIVGCIPRETDGSDKPRPPSKQEAKACSPRLFDVIRMCSPKIIIALGNVAHKYLPVNGPPIVAVTHPSYLLRCQGSNPSNPTSRYLLEEKRWLLTVEHALKSIS